MVIAPPPRRHRVSLDDWLMLLLGAAAVGLLVYRAFWHPPAHVERIVLWTDRGLCAVFAVEFVVRWWQSGFTRRFALVNWYDLVGMIPVAHVWVRVFRLLRVVRIGVQLTRLARPVDRSVGEELAHRAMSRFGGTLIDVVKKPLTVAVLAEVASVLRTGHYARNLASALDENRAEIRAMVLDKIRQDPTAGRLRRLPFHDEIIGAVTDATLRVVLEMLADPRTDELISDLLRENLTQIREAVHTDAHRNLPDPTPPDR
ncbi:ion transporter [Actinokineospora inagensis]|uniref:ion transporter n=1 Tax=Actinokineospora inagensis TaxID=103730 RepID=UPI00040EEC21|nr:ion transporter [Actinokineospora inagensis]